VSPQSPKPRTFLVFFFASLIALFLVDVSSGQRWSSEELSATPASVAFTGVAPASSQSHGIVVLNSGERSLVITAVHVNTTVFGVSTPTLPLTLGPGESANLSVTCSPATSGTFAGSLAIKYGRWSGRTHSLAIPLSASTSGSTTPSPVLQSIAVSPASPSIAVGGTQQFLATGSFSDGSTQNLTTSATWTSSNSQEAGISRGLATGVAAGSVTITASEGGVSSPPVTLSVTAAAPTLTSIAVTPSTASIAVGQTEQFTATGTFSNGSTQNLTTSAAWTSSNSQEAGVSRGLATGATAGSVTITASEGGVSSPAVTLSVTAAPATLTSIAVTPSAASIAVGQTEQFTATGTYSNNTVQNLTSSVTWSASPSDASISSTGLATGTAAGQSNITATMGSVTSSTTAVLTVTEATAPTGNAFYVSTTGSDSNPGTQSSPWKTIQHAANTVQAGDTVYVRAGVYNESVNIAVSGSATAGPVTFASYPGETAVVDGTGLAVSSSAGTQGLFNLVNQSYVTIQGFEIRNYTTSNANVTPAGIWVTGAGSNVQLLNNLVHNITTTSETNGNAFGIAVYGSSGSASIDSITINGNQVYDNKTGNSETVNVDGNVTNFKISNNLVHDNDNIGIDAIGFEGVAPSASVDFARNGEISGNTIYNISAINNPGEGKQYDADGIYIDGGSQIVVERNLVYNCDLNIEAASEHSGHVASFVTIRNNVVYNANSVGISIGGYASNVGGSDHITIVNNTLFENDTKNTGSGEFQIQYHATNNVFENNIVYATSQALFINNFTNSEADPVTADYNLYFSSVNAALADFQWDGKDSTGFSAYQAAASQDAHSSYANPDFVSLTTPDLQVQPGSPALGAGNNLGPTIEGTEDFAGNPRTNGSSFDLGAYQQ